LIARPGFEPGTTGSPHLNITNHKDRASAVC